MSRYKLNNHVMYNKDSKPTLGVVQAVQTAVSKSGSVVTYTMDDGTQVVEQHITGEVMIKKPRASRSRKTPAAKAVEELKGMSNGTAHVAAHTQPPHDHS